MLVQYLVTLLTFWRHIGVAYCNKNESQESYLIEQSNVKGINVGEEVRWTLDLKGRYIIDSARINVATFKDQQVFWMTVNDSQVLHHCNETFSDEDGWVVIKCNESMVIGVQLTIMTIKNNDYPIKNNVTIDLCSKTIYPIVGTNFVIDSSSHNDKNITMNSEGKSVACLSFSDWLNYSNWITIDFKTKLFFEKFSVMSEGISLELFNEVNVQVSGSNIPGLFDIHEPSSCVVLNLTTIDNSIHWKCDKMGSNLFITYKLQHSVKEFSICEFLIFGYIENEFQSNNRIEKCKFKILKKIQGNNLKKNEFTFLKNRLISLVILIGSIIFIACFAWGIYKWKFHLNHSFLKKDLQTNRLQHHINRKLMNGKLDNEFLKLPNEYSKPYTIGLTPPNLSKNRFRNIIPFDYNLVTLEDDKKNYINASFIRGFGGDPRAYIATQGPKTNTLYDFWNLVWQYKVDVIVMLMEIVESNSKKCEQYWPNCDQHEAIFGKILVTIVKECRFDEYVRRHLIIRLIDSEEAARAVVHMQFLSWNDYQVPVQCFTLLNFREQVNSLQKHSQGPLLVHCSAGVGRAGTYIAIDYLIKQAEQEGKVSVYKCVKDLRLQRMNMVQNKKQYVFIYNAVNEASMISKTGMHCIDFLEKFHGIMRMSSAQKPSSLSQIAEEERANLYKVLKKLSHVNPQRTSKDSKDIKKATKLSNNECDQRPDIKDGSRSEHVTAVSIKFHRMNNALILAEVPIREKWLDFWRMLWEYNIDQILLLEDDERCYYWPKINPLKFDGLCIRLKMEDKGSAYCTIRKFVLTKEDEGDSMKVSFKQVTQYHVTNDLWHEFSHVPANKHEFQKILKQLLNTNKGIILQCLNGIGRCGLTAAAMIMIDMILLDEVVDPFLACRYVLSSRPEAFSNQEQYHFLYELALESVKDSGKYSFFFQTNSMEEEY